MAPSGSESYPYGLRLLLSDEVLEELGLKDSLPALGSELRLEAVAVVVRREESTDDPDGDDDGDACLALQITSLGATAEKSTSEKAASMFKTTK